MSREDIVSDGDFIRREKGRVARDAGDFGVFKEFFRICAGAFHGEGAPILGGWIVITKARNRETKTRTTLRRGIKMGKFEESATRNIIRVQGGTSPFSTFDDGDFLFRGGARKSSSSPGDAGT